MSNVTCSSLTKKVEDLRLFKRVGTSPRERTLCLTTVSVNNYIRLQSRLDSLRSVYLTRLLVFRKQKKTKRPFQQKKSIVVDSRMTRQSQNLQAPLQHLHPSFIVLNLGVVPKMFD